MVLAHRGLLGLAMGSCVSAQNPREVQSLPGIMPTLELSAPPRSMRDWQPMWVQRADSRTAPQFYFLVYEPGVILGDDMRFLDLDPAHSVPERASDYLAYLLLVDRERGERAYFTRRELGDVLRGHWRDFMGIWYPFLERAGLMACGMKISEGHQYGITGKSKEQLPPAHAR